MTAAPSAFNLNEEKFEREEDRIFDGMESIPLADVVEPEATLIYRFSKNFHHSIMDLRAQAQPSWQII
jgi:hypothetical protein